MDETARLATGVHARQVRFVRGKAKFCSLVATLCGVTTYSRDALKPATVLSVFGSTCVFP